MPWWCWRSSSDPVEYWRCSYWIRFLCVLCILSAGMQLHMCFSIRENVYIILALPQSPGQHHEMVLAHTKAWALFDLSYPWILDMDASRFKAPFFLLRTCESVSLFCCWSKNMSLIESSWFYVFNFIHYLIVVFFSSFVAWQWPGQAPPSLCF